MGKEITPEEKQRQIDNFINMFNEEQEKLRAERFKEKGYLPFLNFPEGLTPITLLKEVPKTFESRNGERWLFAVMNKGKDFNWSLNPRNPVVRQLLTYLNEAPIDLHVIRVGQQAQTRYTIINPALKE